MQPKNDVVDFDDVFVVGSDYRDHNNINTSMIPLPEVELDDAEKHIFRLLCLHVRKMTLEQKQSIISHISSLLGIKPLKKQ